MLLNDHPSSLTYYLSNGAYCIPHVPSSRREGLTTILTWLSVPFLSPVLKILMSVLNELRRRRHIVELTVLERVEVANLTKEDK